MTLTVLDNVFWAAGFAGHVALFSILVIRHRLREFPVFGCMMLFHAVATVVLYAISPQGHSRPYFWAYWITSFMDYGLQIALVFEIARSVLRPTKTWVRDARSSFLGWSVLGMALATGVAAAIGASAAKGLGLWEVRATLFTSVLILELFLSMSAAGNRLGLPWRSHVMALGQGISAVAVVNVLSGIAHMHYGWSREFVIFDRFSQGIYLGSLVYWMVAFWKPERERKPLSKEMQEYLLALHRRVQYDLEVKQNAENSL